jgi:hypothetical protein
MNLTKETFEDWQARLKELRGTMDPAGSYWVGRFVALLDEIASRCADINVSGNARDCKGEALQFSKAIQSEVRDRHYRTMLKRAESLSGALAIHINSAK